MKAALYRHNGPAGSVLELMSMPTPEPAPGEVLVKLATSGVNPSDVKSRAGRPLAFDFIVPHSDGAGIVEAVGEGVDPSHVGTRVWIWNGQWKRQFGTAAEYVSVPQFQAVKLDDDVSFETAACFGIPGLTAAYAANLIDMVEANTVLVTGAASSVGHYATQLISRSGRRVLGTASAEKHEAVLSAGADAAIDYKSEDVAGRILELTAGEGVEAVVDIDFLSTSRLISSPALKANGTIYCYGSNDMGNIDVPFRDLLFKSIRLQFFLVYELDRKQRSAAIDRLNAFIRSGRAITRISHTLPLEEIADAHERVEQGKSDGNVVLMI